MLNLLHCPVPLSQINLQRTSKQLEQNLKASLGNSRIISALGQLIPNEGMLRPSKLMEAEDDTCIAEFLPNQITTCIVDVGVFDAEDEAYFAFEFGKEIDCVV